MLDIQGLLMRVARHKSKVACFDFDVVYEPGGRNPADNGSRNPVSGCVYFPSWRERREEYRMVIQMKF